MKQATTPTIRLTADVNTDFAYFDEIRINMYGNSASIVSVTRDKEHIIIDKNVIEFTLSQEETLMFDGKCFIEVRVKLGDKVIGFRTVSCYIIESKDKVIM